MLLGAWTASIAAGQDRLDVKRILDIGTGTGILALMMAQTFTEANITAIEPNQNSFEEAASNFKNSPFSRRILPIHTKLQDFSALEKFDLIICNPPYFDGTYKSGDVNRDQARHYDDLMAHELFECVAELLSEYGRFNFIIPHLAIESYIDPMSDSELYFDHILHTKKEDGEPVRLLASAWRYDHEPDYQHMIVKYSNGNYSEAYIELTKEFYATDLRTLQK